MLINKKSLLILSLFITSRSLSTTAPVENYESGEKTITAIMSNETTGIAAYNKKNINYAETLNLANDLNIAQIAEYFGCKTLIGKNFITETLKTPVNSQDKDSVLANRQNVIKVLVENPTLKKEVDELLELAKTEEKEVIKLFSEFFIGRNCPELKALEMIKEQNPALYPFFEFLHTDQTGKTVSTTLNIVGLAGAAISGGYLAKFTYQFAKSGLPYRNLALYTGYLALAEGIYSYTLYKDYSTAAEKRTKIHALNQLITVAEKIEALCNKQDLKTQFKISDIKSKEGIELIEKIKHARYEAKDSLFFYTPAVHAFLYTILQQKTNLAEIFASLAEMDAYNAIATKMINAQHEKNKFCFATFLDNPKPVIKTTAFWNVLVKDAVANNLQEDKHIILTGPNAGGKTTAIRALLQNIVLAQSFGVAAAESFEFTLFDIVHSYLNISDDILNGLSLFASEVKRAQEILEKMKSLDANKKFFFTLDELFTGTVSEDGEACAYKFISKIMSFEGVQFIYATHFGKLTEISDENNLCANYKVNAPTKNDAGKLVYPYTLTQGINQARVAMDIAQAANLFE